MELLYAVILGVVQGVAEFLPISSSGHLVIAETLLQAAGGGPLPAIFHGLTMEIALHAGTLLSIVVIYFRDLLLLTRKPQRILQIFLASIPVACTGFLLRDVLEPLFDSALAAGCCLLVTAVMLRLSGKWRKQNLTEDEFVSLTTGRALLIGCFQAVAILPGISRSGMTISTGLIAGISGEEAARFSFQLALPAIGGATLLELIRLLGQGAMGEISLQPLLAGAGVSFITGVIALRWLLAVLDRGQLHRFSPYCGGVGLAVILWQVTSAF